jgi:PAS domain S-box-containing protein
MRFSRKLVPWLVAALLLLTLLGSLSFWSFQRIEDAAALRVHTSGLINKAGQLLSSLRDAETGQRGYLLTGDTAYLEHYLVQRDSINGDLQELQHLTLLDTAQKPLAALKPLIDAKLAEMTYAIELRRSHGLTTALALVRNGQGLSLMDSIRGEMATYLVLEEDLLAGREASFQADMRHLLVLIVVAGILALTFALAFGWLIFRRTQQRVDGLVLLETRHFHETQEEMNARLQEANATLQGSEENYAVTLNSIGDAVITTDAQARVTRLNPVAEQLTGWAQAESVGRPIYEVFQIINQETRLPSTIPVMDALAHGTKQGLANHTVLIARDGSETAIADSCAPILDRGGRIIGAVLVFRDVTEEYAAQQALRDSKALIETVLGAVVDGIVTIKARDGVVATMNPAAERMFGYDPAQIIGQNASLLIPALEQIERDGSLDFSSENTAVPSAGRLEREVVGRRKDGTVFPLEIAVSEMWLGGQRFFTGILRDITARKQAEEALLNAGALQRSIFNSAYFSSIATDAKGVIQIFNVGAERMLGYKAEEVVDLVNPADISDPDEVVARASALSAELGTTIAPGFEAMVFKASRDIEDIYELTYIRKDGSRFPAVLSVTALRDAHEAIIGYLLIAIDNSARKRVEAERAMFDQILLDKNAELERARIVADKANLAKSEFLSSMSHELRTPLGAILGFAQLMESAVPAPSPSQLRSINQILQAGWYLLELINEILDLALIESGKLSLSLEPTSLSEVMNECRAMIEAQAKKRNISMTFPTFPEALFVFADRTRLKQVLINLLSNAIKYNRNGGAVSVQVSTNRPDSIRISVGDNGMGLSVEQIAQLFQPFNRLGQEANLEEGTGIGLVVCKRLVELMGGSIGVESAVGEGCVFWIEMSLTPEHRPQDISPASEAGVDVPTAASGQQFTLLYVEDNPANLMLIEDIIARRPDIRLLSAWDGNSGVELARSVLPDVILMDINLPGISGVHALKILASDPATQGIPVIALSANAVPRDIEKGLAAGFFRYLTKPIRVGEFMNTLDLALKSTRPDGFDPAGSPRKGQL